MYLCIMCSSFYILVFLLCGSVFLQWDGLEWWYDCIFFFFFCWCIIVIGGLSIIVDLDQVDDNFKDLNVMVIGRYWRFREFIRVIVLCFDWFSIKEQNYVFGLFYQWELYVMFFDRGG